MRRFLVVLLMILIPASLFAVPELYLMLAPETGYTTNMFSNPLPQNGDYLYRSNISFLSRINLGLFVRADVLYSPKAKSGLSTSIQIRFPMYAKETTIDNPDSDNWNYVTSNALSRQDTHVFFGFGLAFRMPFNHIDFCLDTRVTIGSFDYFTTGFIVGLQAEIFINVFVTKRFYISTGVNYDAHLFKILDSSLPNVYQEGFTMLTIGGYIGLGFVIGGSNE